MKSKAVNSDPVTAGVREVKDDLTAGIAEYLGVGSSMANRREYLIFLAASLLVSLGILSLLGYIYLWPLLKPYYAIISDPEKSAAYFGLQAIGRLSYTSCLRLAKCSPCSGRCRWKSLGAFCSDCLWG